MDRRGFWDRYLQVYDGLNGLEGYRSALEEVAARLDVGPGDLVLDAGSGTGNLSVALGDLGARVVGLDFSPTALQMHRRKDPEAMLLRASLESALPFRSGTFDRVACLSVLFAISERGSRLALREFRRVLRPGGRLIITSMKPRTSKLRILTGHLQARRASQSLFRFLRETGQTMGTMLRLLGYNYLMRRLSGQGGYRRLRVAELASGLEDAGFTRINYDSTYGGFFHLIEASVPARAPEWAPARGRPAGVRPRSAEGLAGAG